MGSPPGELGRSNDEGQVSVTLTRAFYLETAEVTQGQWKALSGGVNPSDYEPCGDSCPAVGATWWSGIGYLNARSAAEGLSPCYTLPAGCTGTWQAGNLVCGDSMPAVNGGDVYNCEGYRLPTEAEWEYAARAGTTTATYGGNLNSTSGCVTLTGAGSFASGTALYDLAWYDCNHGFATKAVRGKAANAWGLYDMLGNVWEWTWDRYDSTSGTPGTNPQRNSTGANRVLRGGFAGNNASFLRAARRYSAHPDSYGSAVVRVARTAPQGHGYVFDSAAATMTVAGAGFGLGQADFTYETWLRADQTTAGGMLFTTNATESQRLWVQVTALGGDLKLDAFMAQAPNYCGEGLRFSQIPLPRDNGWHHFAAVRNGSVMEGYLDGALVATQSLTWYGCSCGATQTPCLTQATGRFGGGTAPAGLAVGPTRFSSGRRYTGAFVPGYDWAVDGSTIGQWNVTSGYAGGTLVDQAGADNNGTGGAGLTSISFP